MGSKKKQEKVILVFLTVIISILLPLTGCTSLEDKNQKNIGEEDDNIGIIGNWSMVDNTYNISYKYVYRFYENNSFFTGVENMSSQHFVMHLWGVYSINESMINLTVTEENSTSTLKYSISDDGDSLLLYYEDETNFEVLTREE